MVALHLHRILALAAIYSRQESSTSSHSCQACFFLLCSIPSSYIYVPSCWKLVFPKKVYFRISGSGCRCRSIKFHFHLREGKVWNEQTQLIFQLEILDPFFHDDDMKDVFFQQWYQTCIMRQFSNIEPLQHLVFCMLDHPTVCRINLTVNLTPNARRLSICFVQFVSERGRGTHALVVPSYFSQIVTISLLDYWLTRKPLKTMK